MNGYERVSSIVCTVTFNANGGEGTTPAAQTVYTGTGITLPGADGLSKAGFTFGGWNVNDAGTGINYGANFSYTPTDNVTLYAKWNPVDTIIYAVGDTGPGGGIIFYRSETGFIMTDTGETCHYLEAAPADMASVLAWASSYWISEIDIKGTSTAIGTGRKNTAIILATDANAPAAKACNDYSNNNITDWFLPSLDELNQLYNSMALIGNLTASFYWSSSQFLQNYYAYGCYFSSNTGDWALRENKSQVRAIRAFWGRVSDKTNPDTCTVTFNSDGGSSVSTQTINSGDTASCPDNPTRSGYTFDNWYSNSGLTIVYNFSTPVTGNITLYAKWILIDNINIGDTGPGGG